MHDDLETLLRHHYKNAALSNEQLERIEGATRREQRPGGRFLLRWVTAAVVAIALIIPALVIVSPGSPIATLSTDISRNHLANKPADFYAPDLNALATLFHSSGLTVRLPDLLNAHGQITGARLCSLAGQPAIHIYFSDSDDERKSLFIARAQGALEDANTLAIENEAIAILTWAENGHFYALAKDFK